MSSDASHNLQSIGLFSCIFKTIKCILLHKLKTCHLSVSFHTKLRHAKNLSYLLSVTFVAIETSWCMYWKTGIRESFSSTGVAMLCII